MQPDSATMNISYSPKDLCVELKSLKYYLTSFRTVEIFHESVPAIILKALDQLLHPKWIVVEGLFAIRGGVVTTVTAQRLEDEKVKQP